MINSRKIFAETVAELRTNTYLDKLMKTGGQVEEMESLKKRPFTYSMMPSSKCTSESQT